MKEIAGRNGGILQVPEKGDPPRNPEGPKPGYLQTKTIIKRWLEAKEKAVNALTGAEEELTQLDWIVLAQLKKAKENDTVAFNALLDRAEGKPKQYTELSVDPDKPLPGAIDYDKLPTETLQAILQARIENGGQPL